MLSPVNATELAALAMKHAVVQRDVAHLVLPDNVQELPGHDDPPARPRRGRMAATGIAPPADGLARAVELLRGAERPAIVIGNGARPHRDAVMALAEHLDAPVISTFKAKGIFPDDHALGCGVLGRSGIPVASQTVAQADCGRVASRPSSRRDRCLERRSCRRSRCRLRFRRAAYCYSTPSARLMVWKRSVWSVMPTTLAVCGPWAAMRTSYRCGSVNVRAGSCRR